MSRKSARQARPQPLYNLADREPLDGGRCGALAELTPDIKGQLRAIGFITTRLCGARQRLQDSISRVGKEALFDPCADRYDVEVQGEAAGVAIASDVKVLRHQYLGQRPLRAGQQKPELLKRS